MCCVCSYMWCSANTVDAVYAWVYVSVAMYACLGRGCICTGRESVNKSVWGLGVWGWNMVPGMWSNVKNSATPGNNKSPDVATPQNKYTPLYKSSIWTMSRNKDAPNTSPTHTHTSNSHTYLRTHLFVCWIKWSLPVDGWKVLFFFFFCEWDNFFSRALFKSGCLRVIMGAHFWGGVEAGGVSGVLSNDRSQGIK